MARNFSCRPAEFFGLDCETESLIAKDFDLTCNLRLVLNDFERDKKMAEAIMMSGRGGGQEMEVNDGLLEESMASPLNQMN